MAKKRKGKMPPGLARYWAGKRKAKKARSAPKKKRRAAKRKPATRVRRMHGPTRRSLGRDIRAHHSNQIRTAKALIQDELKAMRTKLSLLGKGLTGRAGRRK